MGVERPTHPRLHVRHVYDAHKILEAVRMGQLRLVQRRLNETERHNFICSGSVFVWEESDEENGLKRWTDGKAFGQSRMRGDFLFYEEKPDGTSARQKVPTTMWSSSVMRAEQGYPFAPSVDQDPMALVKQTYSAFFKLPGERKLRKWHMTAYFTYADLPNLPTLDMDPILTHIQVPTGLYRSGKARSRPSMDSDSTPPKLTPPLPQYQAWNTFLPPSPTESCHMSARGLAHSMHGLPSLRTLVSSGPESPRSGSRVSEDQRLIHLLNSKTVL